VIAVLAGALAFKGVDFATAVAEAVEAEEAQPEAPDVAAPAPEGAGPGDAEAPPEPAASCPPDVAYLTESGISEQEISVLRSLQERRKALDEREAALETREQVAAAAEARLNEQISEIKGLEGGLKALLAEIDVKRDQRLEALVKTYEAMKAKDAARIFDTMEDTVLLDLAKGMKPATLAAVMASMDPKRAEALTRMLASLAKTPADVEALQKTRG
jgi:flagellar motility protein MotE (MotC chaperone)